MRWSSTLSFICVVAFVAGCGGSSKDNDVFEDDDGVGGSSGSLGGGSGASFAGAAAAGVGQGGRAMGGGGAANQPRAGTGSGNGGAAMLPPELQDRCDAMCDQVEGAACANDDGGSDCRAQCRLAANQVECAQAYETLFDCTEGKQFTCDAEEQATAAGCELQYGAAGLCLLASAPDPELEAPCTSYCTDVAAAECISAEPLADCVYGCQSAGGLFPQCASLWRGYLTCAETATISCNAEGDAVAEGCEPEFLIFTACALEEFQG